MLVDDRTSLHSIEGPQSSLIIALDVFMHDLDIINELF